MLFPEIAIEIIPKLLDEKSTPFWACRYAILLGTQEFLGNKGLAIVQNTLLEKKKDSHRFINKRISKMKRDGII